MMSAKNSGKVLRKPTSRVSPSRNDHCGLVRLVDTCLKDQTSKPTIVFLESLSVMCICLDSIMGLDVVLSSGKTVPWKLSRDDDGSFILSLGLFLSFSTEVGCPYLKKHD